jgi:protein required for attachment to host cells
LPAVEQLNIAEGACMQTSWIVAADNGRARIFAVEDGGKNFQEIRSFVDEAGRGREQDLHTDAKGRYFGRGERNHGPAAQPDVDPIQHETERFVKQVCEYLDKAAMEKKFGALFVVAYPKFIGVLRANLSGRTQALITREIAKDISWFDGKDILEFYANNRPH